MTKLETSLSGKWKCFFGLHQWAYTEIIRFGFIDFQRRQCARCTLIHQREIGWGKESRVERDE